MNGNLHSFLLIPTPPEVIEPICENKSYVVLVHGYDLQLGLIIFIPCRQGTDRK
jgi:hypothetical protein